MSNEPGNGGEAGVTPPRAPRRPFLTSRRLAWLAGTALALAALVFFVADNFVLVDVRLATLRIQARLAWVMLIPFVLGIAVGAGAMLLARGWRAVARRRGDGDRATR